MKKFLNCLFACCAMLPLYSQNPNWAEHVAPILYSNCTNCHIEGGIAPFSLVGYQKAKTYANSIKSAAESRSMPPWPANSQYRRYAHERILSSEEIQTIANWVNTGKDEGNPALAPAPPVLKSGTSIVNPDLRLKMPDYTVNTIEDEYRCFVIPAGINADKFITEMEVVPGDLTVVHHVLVFYDTSSLPLQLDNADPKPGYLGFGGTGSASSKLIGVWVPGQEPFKMPAGMGIKIQKNGYVILQVHYPSYVSNKTDSSKVYFKLSNGPLRDVAIAPALNHDNGSLTNGPLYIPANQSKTFTSKFTLPTRVSVFAVAPHMHLLGKSIKAFGVSAANDTVRFVDIPKWDFHWQRTYLFPKVLKLEPGTLWAEASYDNTTANPNNPSNPPKAVSLGEGTKDEMLLVYFWYTLYQSGDENIVIDGSEPKNLSSKVIVNQPRLPYPNPAEEYIELPSCGDWVFVYDTKGRLLQQIKTNSTAKRINLGDIPSGVLIIKTIVNNQSQNWYVVKK